MAKSFLNLLVSLEKRCEQLFDEPNYIMSGGKSEEGKPNESIERTSGEVPGNFKTQRIRAGNSSGQGERKSEDVQSDENS